MDSWATDVVAILAALTPSLSASMALIKNRRPKVTPKTSKTKRGVEGENAACMAQPAIPQQAAALPKLGMHGRIAFVLHQFMTFGGLAGVAWFLYALPDVSLTTHSGATLLLLTGAWVVGSLAPVE
jgi:hypothetical protein